MVLVMPSTEIAQWYSILIQKIIEQGESPWKYVTLNENFFHSFDTKEKIMQLDHARILKMSKFFY